MTLSEGLEQMRIPKINETKSVEVLVRDVEVESCNTEVDRSVDFMGKEKERFFCSPNQNGKVGSQTEDENEEEEDGA